MVSSECSQNKACINNKCRDPCPGTCGINARCQVVNHNPICSCPPNYLGDPFVRCIVDQSKLLLYYYELIYFNFKLVSLFLSAYVLSLHALSSFLETPVESTYENPCVPSPCGLNSQCRVIGSQAACSCLPNYIGRAPNCRPECTINEECPSNLACQNERCKDPCPGSCGSFTTCVVIKHAPTCQCVTGYTGDPFSGCSISPPRKTSFLQKNTFFLNYDFTLLKYFIQLSFQLLQ